MLLDPWRAVTVTQADGDCPGWRLAGTGTTMLLHWHGCRQRLARAILSACPVSRIFRLIAPSVTRPWPVSVLMRGMLPGKRSGQAAWQVSGPGLVSMISRQKSHRSAPVPSVPVREKRSLGQTPA